LGQRREKEERKKKMGGEGALWSLGLWIIEK
jgi:hypothetical protein